MADGVKLSAEEIILLRFGLWKERRHRIDLGIETAQLDRLDERLLVYLTDVCRSSTGVPDRQG